MATKVDMLKFSHSYTWVYKKNGGFASAMNYGLSLTNAKYIMGLHDDDELPKDSMQLRIDFMENNPRYAMAYGNAINVRNGNPEKLICPWYPTRKEMYEKLLSVGNFIHGGTYIIKRSALDKIGRWDIQLPTKEDADLWLRIARDYDIGYINANLYTYHIWGQNKSHLLHGTAVKEAAAKRIMAKHGR
jgi:glycosyltransferase involved in cell wall biosynthesis